MTNNIKSHLLDEKQGMFRLDKKDKKLVSALSINSRLPPTHLGKIAGISKDSVRYRINKLKQEQIIYPSSVIINPYALGLKFYTVFLKMHNLETQKEMQFMKFLSEHPNILWCGALGGSWDVGMHIFSKDTKNFTEIFKGITKNAHGLIIDSDIFENYELTKYQNLPKSFKIKNEVDLKNIKRDISFETYFKHEKATIDSSVLKLDSLDKKILLELSEHPEVQIAEISEKYQISFDTVKNRIIELIKSKLILAFNPIFNLTNLGMTAHLILIEVNHTADSDEIERILHENPHTGYIVHSQGKYDWQVYLAVENNYELYATLRDLRNKLGSFLKKYEILMVIQDFKFTFTPDMIKSMFKQ